MIEKDHCELCNRKMDFFSLKKCPICFKLFCEECAFTVSGLDFCSRFCSEFFFHGDSDKEDA